MSLSKKTLNGQLRRRKNLLAGESGAAMLETSMVIIVFLLLLGAIFDLGVALYQYGMLRHTTNQAARDITVELASTNFSTGGGCTRFNNVVDGYLRDKATKLMATGGSNTALVTWSNCMRAGSGPLRSFKLHGDIPVNCFFLCRFFGNAWHLNADSTVTMDSASVPTCNFQPNC